MKQTSKKRFKKLPLILAVVIAVFGVGAAYYWYTRRQPATSQDTSKNAEFNTVDYSPSNSDDKAYNDKIKENIGNNSTAQSDVNANKRVAHIVVIDAAQYDSVVEARALIDNLVESGGQCTYTFTKDALRVERVVDALSDASTTRCKNISISANDFSSKGTWQMAISYSSSLSYGKSNVQTIEVK